MCESLPLSGFQDLYVDYEQVLLAPWKPCTSLLSNTIDNTTSLNIFFFFKNLLYRFYGLILCDISSLLHLQKSSNYTYTYKYLVDPHSNYERDFYFW